VFLLAGCGGSGGDDGGSTGAGTGRLEVAMVDAPPAPDITAVNVTIARVEANVGGQWTALDPPSGGPVTVNLLELAKREQLIGADTLPVGQYTQVRFFPENVTVTDGTGTHPVTVPSGDQTGIKVNVNYDVQPGTVTSVLLDFNVAKSIVRTGNGQYRLQPVIPAVVKAASGTVTGTVMDGAGAPLPSVSVTAVYAAGDAYPVGTEVNTSTTGADGTYKLWALLPGQYALTATYTDAGGVVHSGGVNVTVTAGQNTAAGTITVP
jgi:hypothetical protein